ncbi:hypothetical protein DFR58_101107 [Anaerobacterium chartisolvens]|uniref:PH domain-containing protein n=1 Tax=Anaerobacterium chartisolvens TaxID=1297424 RepID=A0A369BI17_9FIRM|nr:hypothetical protein [Anaerobacterium chartisolvens]RCX20905.1 hypothetical protein DFR58_101107 [Anaerobacterium chartisolvens]
MEIELFYTEEEREERIFQWLERLDVIAESYGKPTAINVYRKSRRITAVFKEGAA